MEKKKFGKLKVAAIVFAVALIAAVGGIIGVYAATQQNVKSAFSVQYSIGENVAIAIGAKTMNSKDLDTEIWFEADTELTKNTTTNLYEIGVNDKDQNLNLHLPEEYNNVIQFETPDTELAVLFYMQNLSGVPINVIIEDNGVFEGDMASFCVYNYPATTEGVPDEEIFAYDTDAKEPINIKEGELCCFMMFIAKVQGDYYNPNTSASYTSNEEGGLSFRFEQA